MKYLFLINIISLICVNISFADDESEDFPMQTQPEGEDCLLLSMDNIRIHDLLMRIDPDLQG